MITNRIGDFLAGMVGKRLDGYKTIIGAVGTLLYVAVIVISHLRPDLGLPGSDIPWVDAGGMLAGALTALGLIHKSYKVGLVTPVPETTAKGMTIDDAPKMGS